MSLVDTVGDILWGTRAYDYGSRIFKSAVGAYTRIEPSETITVGDVSATFRPSSFVEWSNVHTRIWHERRVLEHLLADVRTDDVFFDIGANIGIYSCLVGRLLDGGAVVPFEPYPPNVRRLRVNLAANGLSPTIIERPLAATAGDATLSVHDTVGPGAQHATLGRGYHTSPIEARLDVESVTGDALVADGEIPGPTIVKIDVQGTEDDVLSGLERALGSDACRRVYVETHDNLDDIARRLGTMGFAVETIPVDRPGKDPTVVGHAKRGGHNATAS
ncbi:hypothetical protein C440_02193 [Haloferax mucosum ATCC BAA-1512]|uniref:Methyltransferase FkbM domain-containing protein n=1 Tax=Haloferax mucosum ATCC BAA-1512 TaxID=662479 RepID=M0IMT7_9EURY|nr:FkbM family methyltransferase [Haloferax mucosum]ELZ98020.1 hypothetical protein C440_02193 [Haloferax mucosum ATCC BAA-1512]